MKQEASKPAASTRYRELDALRGLAALAVVLFHYTVRYEDVFVGAHMPVHFTAGSYGVEVFFGISGFVILMTLERSKTAAQFLVSRFSRLYPAYWVCLVLTFCVLLMSPLPQRNVTWGEAAMNFTMWQEMMHVRHVDGVYWSLQIELIFYVLMLLVFVTGQLKRIRSLVLAWLCLAIGAKVVAALVHHGVPYTAERFLLLPYAAYFAIGGASYLDFRAARLSPATALTFVLAGLSAWLWHGAGGVITALGMTLLFAALVMRKATWLDNRPLVFLGTISYSLYLVHQNIGYVIIHALSDAGLPYSLDLLAAIAIVLALACGVTFLVEQPALHWIRDRVRNGKSRLATGKDARAAV